jgi:uncharacterized protein (TIGR02099 family)
LKHFTVKWLKRFYILIAISLVILAILLTSARILFISVGDYKEQASNWLHDEYQINISVQDLTAGIDFTGMVLTLNDVALLDSEDLPFVLELDHLFFHLNFWDSVKQRKLNFNSVSLQGARLNFKKGQQSNTSEKSLDTINRLKDIFLTQLKKVSIRDSSLHFIDQLGLHKTIVIEQLNWSNKGAEHQGVGKANLPDALGTNSLKFVIDLTTETDSTPIDGHLYLQADNLNITDYLIKQVNSNAKMIDAVVGFEAWMSFSSDKLNSIQLQFNESLFSWSQLDVNHSWRLSNGLLQLTNNDKGWLLDSYDLDIKRNDLQWNDLSIRGQGDQNHMLLDFDGLDIKNIIPFYLLYSDLNTEQISSVNAFDFDGHVNQIGISRDDKNNVQFNLLVSEFKNRPVGAIPGVSNANIKLTGNDSTGNAIINLANQKIYFDGQFSRTMRVNSGDIQLQWLEADSGFTLKSEYSKITTPDLDVMSEFSIFLPKETSENQSPFLSLYSYANLNDASQAKYYFPIQVLGEETFEYLEPTIKKGQVEGAKIIWYGELNNYPYFNHNGIFQAYVPLRDAQYDFYEDWQGLTDLDIDLLFENDYLLMNAQKASLGSINIGYLQGQVDHLHPDGVLTINAALKEDAQKISNYLKSSPLSDSVGKALTTLKLTKPVSGNIALTVPFNSEKAQAKIEGNVLLENNTLDMILADNLVLPLKQVNGEFSFIDGNLSAKNINALIFEQPISIGFSSIENKNTYKVNADISSIWNINTLSQYNPQLAPFKQSGTLDWFGNVDFVLQANGRHDFDVVLHSSTLGMTSQLPNPFEKSALQSWPIAFNLSGSDDRAKLQLNIKDKLSFEGQFENKAGETKASYFNLNIGQSKTIQSNKAKQIVNIDLDKLNVELWYEYWKESFSEDALSNKNSSDKKMLEASEKANSEILLTIDEVNVNVNHLDFFNQPLAVFSSKSQNINGRWETQIASDQLQTRVEYRPGIPVRFDVKTEKFNFQSLDLNSLKKNKHDFEKTENVSANLRQDYPEVFIDCKSCIYNDIDFSPLSLHVYPTKKRLNIDYIKIGGETEFTNITGFWDQYRTNFIFDSEADTNKSMVTRLGFASPVYHQQAQLSGAFYWIGAPWEANFESLNGAFSSELKDGAITEVSDNGARLLSLFSLDSIRRSLNLEFDNVFAKGFKFDELTFSGIINDGVLSNDDFYLDGSAGKITGEGLVDLTHQNTNYRFSYSPDVTSSLPVLAAFTINPLTGAAVLMLTKLLEPVVDTIIRVDFTVKGNISDPEVRVVTQQEGQITLENSEVLQQMSEQQQAKRDQQSENQEEPSDE